MRERHRYSHEIPELLVKRFHAAEDGDDDEDDDEEEEEQRHDGEEEEEEEEPVWTASGSLVATTRFFAWLAEPQRVGVEIAGLRPAARVGPKKALVLPERSGGFYCENAGSNGLLQMRPEPGHRAIKRRVMPAKVFDRSMERGVQGYEVLHRIRKGQVRWLPKEGVVGQIQFIRETLGLKS